MKSIDEQGPPFLRAKRPSPITKSVPPWTFCSSHSVIEEGVKERKGRILTPRAGHWHSNQDRHQSTGRERE